MLETMKYMDIPLPEQIAKAKWAGDFEKAERLIHLALQSESVPVCMKERLRLEQSVLRVLPEQYPYSAEEALAVIRKEIPNFTMEELAEWTDRNAADWIYINHQVHYHKEFFASMKKVYSCIAERAGSVYDPNRTFLDESIHAVKKEKEVSWHWHIRTELKINDSCFEKGKEVTVQMPLPSVCDNMQNIELIACDPEPVFVDDASSLSRTVTFRRTSEDNLPFTVEYAYDSVIRYTDLKPEDVQPCSISDYLDEMEPQIVFTPFIRHLAEELKQGETNPLRIARKFYDYCTTNITYSFVREYFTITSIPEYAAGGLKGDCGILALLFITLCRYAGIPAKWQSGLFVTEKSIGNHDWARFYIEPYGWLFADPSFGGAAYRANDQERWDYYFGHLDPFRMAANQEFMQEFNPPKKQMRFDPYDNQTGEIEYADHGLQRSDYTVTHTLLKGFKK